MILRDATPSDAPFLAKCIMAGMHFYDFETDPPEDEDIYGRLVGSERTENWPYSYRYTRVAEVDGLAVGSLLSYPGDIYRDFRQKTFSALWPELSQIEAESDLVSNASPWWPMPGCLI